MCIKQNREKVDGTDIGVSRRKTNNNQKNLPFWSLTKGFYSNNECLINVQILMEKSVRKEEIWAGSTSPFYCFAAAVFSSSVFDNFLIVTI